MSLIMTNQHSPNQWYLGMSSQVNQTHHRQLREQPELRRQPDRDKRISLQRKLGRRTSLSPKISNMQFFDEIKLGTGHSLIVGNMPRKITLEQFNEAMA